MIEWTITLGNLINIGTLLAGAITIYLAMKMDIVALGKDVKFLSDKQTVLNEAFNQLGSILTQVAVQDNRIHMLEQQIDELRHGNGYIRREIKRKS